MSEAEKIMSRLAAMPHKPHVDETTVKLKKKDGDPPAKKSRRAGPVDSY
jgi:hypothetical protein